MSTSYFGMHQISTLNNSNAPTSILLNEFLIHYYISDPSTEAPTANTTAKPGKKKRLSYSEFVLH